MSAAGLAQGRATGAASPVAGPLRRIAPRAAFAALVLATVVAGILSFDPYEARGRTLAVSSGLGLALGIVLQRSRFCFLCNIRDLHDTRDPSGVLALLVALLVGILGYQLVFGAWMPVPSPERLPPTAHVGPVSIALVVASFVFGVGMSVSGSCLSGHLYRLGEGSTVSVFALLGALPGFALGFVTWNPLYLSGLASGPSLWLPHLVGYAGHLALSLAGVLALIGFVLALGRAKPAPASSPAGSPLGEAARRTFVERWPPVLAGVLVAAIGTLAYLRVSPLGVTAELGSLARTGAASAGLLPETLHGLDRLRGCIAAVKTAALSPNGVLVLGLVAGSLASAVLAGQFRPARITPRRAVEGVVGGVMMGWGATTALGCTVGVLLSGIQAGAVAGWVFLAACTAGVLAGFRLMRVAGGGSVARKPA